MLYIKKSAIRPQKFLYAHVLRIKRRLLAGLVIRLSPAQ